MSKTSEKRKNHYYNLCVQYVKKRNHGLNPKDTSYERIAFFLERYLDVQFHGTAKQRCKEAAFKLGIIKSETHGNKSPREIRNKFYQSLLWKKLRYKTLVNSKGQCMCCGSKKSLRVDHIKPISKFWHLRLDPDNVQVLCEDCNWGKLDHDQTDWRYA